jgi:putative aldouronate transport system substrate-binding protein
VFSFPGTVEKIKDAMFFLETGDPTPGNSLGGLLQIAGERSAYGLAIQQEENDEYIYSKLWGSVPEALNRYGTTLDDLLLEGFTQIIQGNRPVSYFDTLVKSWYDAGGREMTDAVNAAYGRK